MMTSSVHDTDDNTPFEDEPTGGTARSVAEFTDELFSDPALAPVRQAAEHHFISPPALLCMVLARLSLMTPISPATRDALIWPSGTSPSPLSLFVCVAAQSGVGKSNLLYVSDYLAGRHPKREVRLCNPSSGAALIDSFRTAEHGAEDGVRGVEVGNPRVLLDYDELSDWMARARSDTNTAPGHLRKAWSSERLAQDITLAHGNKRRVPVPAGEYRLAYVAATTFDTAAELCKMTTRGDSQRWLVVPGTNPAQPRPEDRPPKPTPLTLPEWADGCGPVVIDRQVEQEIAQQLYLVQIGEADPSHEPQVRLRAAPLIGWLRGHPGFAHPEDWRLAGLLIDLNRATRTLVLAEAAELTHAEAREQGAVDAHRLLGRHAEEQDRGERLEAALSARALDRADDGSGTPIYDVTAGGYQTNEWCSLHQDIPRNKRRPVLRERISAITGLPWPEEGA